VRAVVAASAVRKVATSGAGVPHAWCARKRLPPLPQDVKVVRHYAVSEPGAALRVAFSNAATTAHLVVRVAALVLVPRTLRVRVLVQAARGKCQDAIAVMFQVFAMRGCRDSRQASVGGVR